MHSPDTDLYLHPQPVAVFVHGFDFFYEGKGSAAR